MPQTQTDNVASGQPRHCSTPQEWLLDTTHTNLLPGQQQGTRTSLAPFLRADFYTQPQNDLLPVYPGKELATSEMPHKLFGMRLNSIYPREVTRHCKPTVQKRLLCTATAHRFIYIGNKTGIQHSGVQNFPPGKEQNKQVWNAQYWPQQKKTALQKTVPLVPGTNEQQPCVLLQE